MKKIKVYTWSFCPFCNNAKKLLTAKGLSYTEVSIDGNDEMKQVLKEKTGQTTVPFIFIEDTFVGGYTELAGLDHKGDLDKMLV